MVHVNIKVEKKGGDFTFTEAITEHKAMKVIEGFLIDQFVKREQAEISIRVYH